jgi:D-sedoheptulose 7-phosphate isomerase
MLTETVTLPKLKNDYIDMLNSGLSSIDSFVLERVMHEIVNTTNNDKTIFVCGNGGSAAIAEHLSCDHSKGVASNTPLLPRVISLNSNMSLLTATANDYGYDKVFSTQLTLQGRRGDLLIVISSSGNSPNIIQVINAAHALGITTISLTGFDGGEARKNSNINIHVPINNYGVVEDIHQIIMHILAQYIRTIHTHVDIKTVKL